MLARLSMQSSVASRSRGLFSAVGAAAARRYLSSADSPVPAASTEPIAATGNTAQPPAQADPTTGPARPAQAPLSSEFGALPLEPPAPRRPFAQTRSSQAYTYPQKKTRNVPYVPLSQGGTNLAAERQLSVQGSNRHHRAGELYTPADLDESQPSTYPPAIPTLSTINFDVFKAMGTDPLQSYKDVTLLSNFVTETGMLMHRKHTKLSAKNQRKLTKAVKRARAMGLMPHTYRMETEHKSRAPQFSDYLNLSSRS